MKKNTISLLFLSVIVLFLASCTSMRQGTSFSERKYFNFRHHDPVVIMKLSHGTAKKEMVDMMPKQPIVSAPALSAQPSAINPEAVVNNLHPKIAKAIGHINSGKPGNNITTEPYYPIVTGYEPAPAMEMAPTATTGNNSSIDPVILVILAILLAPLAVYLYDNAATTRFWIDLLLWVVGVGLFGIIYFTGILILAAIIYAVLIVLGKV